MNYSKLFKAAASFAKIAQTGQEFDIQTFVSEILVSVKTSNLLAVNSGYPINSNALIFTSVNSVVQNENSYTVNVSLNNELKQDPTFMQKVPAIVNYANRILSGRYQRTTGNQAQFNIIAA